MFALRPDGPGGRSPADRTCKGDAPQRPHAGKESGLLDLTVLPDVMLHRWRRKSRRCGRSSWPRRRMRQTSGGSWVWVPSVTSNRTWLKAGTTCRAQPRECVLGTFGSFWSSQPGGRRLLAYVTALRRSPAVVVLSLQIPLRLHHPGGHRPVRHVSRVACFGVCLLLLVVRSRV